MTAKILGPFGLKGFEQRGISVETAVRFGIYTGSRAGESGEVAPDHKGKIIVFPFEERGAVVAEKYRAPGKVFWQRPGGRRTFWNSDALDDPGLASGHMALIITEGELDALSAIDCGFPLTVSVPDGAPAVRDGDDPENLEPIDPAKENEGKFEFLWNNRDRLKHIKRFIIAVDNDKPGQRLAAELVRRLSASRCMFVEYPPDLVVPDKDLEKWPGGKKPCKDLNDVLMYLGRDAVTNVLNAARPYPVRGLYRLSDYPDLPPIVTYSTGWQMVDRHIRIFPGEFAVVTGIPGHGKSTWVLNLVVNLGERYGWTSAIFSPEMATVPHLRGKLRKILARKEVLEIDREAIDKADGWIDRNMVFIDADPTGREDEDFDLDWILDRAVDAVLRDGIRVLVLDPWNEIEHARKPNESMTDYIGRSIRALKRFARLYDVAVIVVAHPTKEVAAKDGKARPVTLYDIEGSAHWFNKSDHGIVIARPDETKEESLIQVSKVRFEETGEKGAVRLRFDRFCQRFEHLIPETSMSHDA